MKSLRWKSIWVITLCLFAGRSAPAQQQGKAVAHVKGVVISEEEYLRRVQTIHANQFPQNSTTDAGGVTLVTMILDSLTDQLAAEKKLTPSDASIQQLTQIFRRSVPQLEEQLLSHQTTEEDLNRQVRKVLELTAIGSDGAKADPSEIQKMYDEITKEPFYPATYTLRILIIRDAAKANEIFPQLKASGNFQEAARTLKLPPIEMANAGRELILPKKGAPVELIKALEALGNGPFTPEKGVFTNGAVAITQPNSTNPTAPGNTIYLIAQLIGKQAEEKPPLDKIRIFLEQRVLQQKFPQWQMHSQQKVGEFTRTAAEQGQIVIHIDRYKPLLESMILSQANAQLETQSPVAVPPAAIPQGDKGKPKSNTPKKGKFHKSFAPEKPATAGSHLLLATFPNDEGGKAVAHVKGVVISEAEYLERVQRIRSIPPNTQLDAGGLTLINMIQDCLTDQLAEEKKLTPLEASIQQLVGIIRRTTPLIEQQIRSKQLTEAELNRQTRHLLEMTALGTEGVKADPARVQKMYEDMKKTPIFPAMYTIRVLFVPDPVKARDIMMQLKASRDFQAAARTLKMTPSEVGNAGREVVMTKKGAPEELIKALDALGNGPFTPENGPFTNGPITITQKNPANPNAPGRELYIIAQLIDKKGEETPSLEQMRVYLEQRVLQQSVPQWQKVAQQKLGEYTRKVAEQNQIQIHIERYKPLLESVLLAPPPMPQGPPPIPAQGTPPGGKGNPAGPPPPK